MSRTVDVIVSKDADEELRMSAQILVQELKAHGLNASAQASPNSVLQIRMNPEGMAQGEVEIFDCRSKQSTKVALEVASDLIYNQLNKS